MRQQRIQYGNRLVNDMAYDRIKALFGSEGADAPVDINADDRKQLDKLRGLRREAADIERRFTERGLSVPDFTRSATTPTMLDRSYQWKREREQKAEKRVRPLRDRIHKLRQQVQIDLMKATTRPEQGRLIDAYAKALDSIR